MSASWPITAVRNCSASACESRNSIPPGLTEAQNYFNDHSWMSSPDAFAFVLAKTGGHILLTCDGDLSALAASEAVEVHGLLWLLDRMADEAAADLDLLHKGRGGR